MKKILLLLAFTLPLTAQQTETDKEITKQEQRENRTAGMVNTLQDWDFRKYEAAHARAHAKMSKNPQKYRREQMSRRKKSSNIGIKYRRTIKRKTRRNTKGKSRRSIKRKHMKRTKVSKRKLNSRKGKSKRRNLRGGGDYKEGENVR